MTGNGKMSFKRKSEGSRAVLAAALGLAILAGFAGASARAADADADDDDGMLDTKIVRGIMKGLGLRKDEASIDYRERSPLVLPAGKELNYLPAPEPNAVKKTAGWPDDPDVKDAKRRKQAEKDRKPYVDGVTDRQLLPSEYENPNNIKPDNASGGSIEKSSAPSSQAELGTKSMFDKNIFKQMWGAPKEEYTTFVGEPARSSLIEPPPGYRTPSPNQPYGVGKEKTEYKPADRTEPVR